MPGFPTKGVGTPTHRGKARRYMNWRTHRRYTPITTGEGWRYGVSFHGGCQGFELPLSLFQSSVREPDRGYNVASSQRPLRTGFVQM